MYRFIDGSRQLSEKGERSMIGIFVTKIKWTIRNPWTLILMTCMSVLFAFIIGGNSFEAIKVPTYIESSMEDSELVKYIDEDGVFKIDEVSSKEAVSEQIESRKGEFGLVLWEDYFDLVVGVESPHVTLLETKVQNAYVKREQWRNIKNIVGKDLEERQVFQIKSASFTTDDEHIYDARLHSLFGMTLFFVIYTISSSVIQILTEKRNGVWDRMILSPVRKWEMYVGNFLYSFLIGYFQVAMVLFIFRSIINIDFNGKFAYTFILIIPYVITIVALSTFIVAIVKTTQQFNAMIPIVSVSMAMIGGAFWPIEIVESELMLMLSKVVPITYGMDMLQGVTLYGQSFGDVLYPVTILLLMSVILMGMGIHLMERRYIS